MEFKTTVKLSKEEKTTLETASNIINDICYGFEDCEECPMYELCDKVKDQMEPVGNNKYYDLAEMFNEMVKMLTER